MIAQGLPQQQLGIGYLGSTGASLHDTLGNFPLVVFANSIWRAISSHMFGESSKLQKTL
jgi:hypothetical protein